MIYFIQPDFFKWFLKDLSLPSIPCTTMGRTYRITIWIWALVENSEINFFERESTTSFYRSLIRQHVVLWDYMDEQCCCQRMEDRFSFQISVSPLYMLTKVTVMGKLKGIQHLYLNTTDLKKHLIPTNLQKSYFPAFWPLHKSNGTSVSMLSEPYPRKLWLLEAVLWRAPHNFISSAVSYEGSTHSYSLAARVCCSVHHRIVSHRSVFSTLCPITFD